MKSRMWSFYVVFAWNELRLIILAEGIASVGPGVPFFARVLWASSSIVREYKWAYKIRLPN